MARTAWSRPLPRPIVIPKVMALTTLADVRELVEKALASRAPRKTYVALRWDVACRAARGEDDASDVEIALRMVLAIEGIECRPR